MLDETRHDLLTPALAARFAGMLDRPVPADAGPQGIHWCLCPPDAATTALGRDGHAVVDASLPPRRMWASSDVHFRAPIPVGAAIERRSHMVEQTEKRGSSGRLLFVKLDHVTLADGAVAVEETQTIVYREAASPAQPAPRTAFRAERPADGPWRRVLIPSPALLFRYSALTFNSHRIHYDLPYAREVEGYPGLVVHGPLLATLLLDLADRELGSNRLSRFGFRAMAPTFADEPITLTGERDGDTLTLSVRNAAGGVVLGATATIG